MIDWQRLDFLPHLSSALIRYLAMQGFMLDDEDEVLARQFAEGWDFDGHEIVFHVGLLIGRE